MAQIIKLKRTSVAGKFPTVSNLELGELGMNTNDGRIFFEKNDGSATIQEIVTTNPNNPTTGSINLNGSITASSGVQVKGNIMPNADNTLSLGSSTLRFQLNGGTPVTVDGSGTANTITRFQSATTVEDSKIVSSDTATTFTHSNNGNTIFTVSGSNGELLTITDSNTGNLLEVNDASGIDVFTVSATGDVSASGAITASGITGLTSLSVSGTTTTNNLTLSSLSGQGGEATALVINGSNVVGTRELGSNAFNSTSFLTEHPNITPGSNISQDNSDGTVLQDLTITLDSNGHVTTATAGTVNLDGRYYTETESDTLFTKKLGQDIVSGSGQLSYATATTRGVVELFSNTTQGTAANSVTSTSNRTYGIQLNSDNQAVVNVPWTNTTFQQSDLDGLGIVSSSAQIASLTRYDEDVSGTPSYTLTHNLGERYVIVQAYDTNYRQVIPSFVSASSANQVEVSFDGNFAGRIIVKK